VQLGLILLAVAALEWVRKLEGDECILRRDPLGRWRVVYPLRLWRQWHIVSWFPPFFFTVVLPPSLGRRPAVSQLGTGDITGTRLFQTVRVLGSVALLTLLLGIPWATSRFGLMGILVSVAWLLLLTLMNQVFVVAVLRREGVTLLPALRKATSLLSPFAMPLTSETLFSRRFIGAPRMASIRSLTGESDFQLLIQPFAFDLETARVSVGDPWLEEIALSFSKRERARIAGAVPAGLLPGQRYCPRCGGIYRGTFVKCSECSCDLRD
jgi:hypothetical protein